MYASTKEVIFFNNLKLDIPDDYNRNNFSKIDSLFKKLKNKPYSYNAIKKILKQVEIIALQDEYDSINALVEENIVGKNKLDFTIFIDEEPKYFVERVNILGNNITREDVIRNNLILNCMTTYRNSTIYTSTTYCAGVP